GLCSSVTEKALATLMSRMFLHRDVRSDQRMSFWSLFTCKIYGEQRERWILQEGCADDQICCEYNTMD
ncbi:hypothetical protein RRG08_000680, partial [Elysia crispata]